MNAIGVSGLPVRWVIILVCFSSFASPAWSADALAVVLTLDTSPGTEQAIGLLRARAFERGDRVGVVAVGAGAPRVLLRPSEDRDGLASALQRAGVRVGASVGAVSINDNRTVEIASAIKLACHQLQEDDLKSSRRAIILFFGTPDPGLPGQMQTLRSVLDATDARLYVVAVYRSIEQSRTPVGSSPPYPLGSSRGSRPLRVPQTIPFPVATAQMLEQLAKDSGGRMYRRNWDLKEILREARK